MNESLDVQEIVWISVCEFLFISNLISGDFEILIMKINVALGAFWSNVQNQCLFFDKQLHKLKTSKLILAFRGGSRQQFKVQKTQSFRGQNGFIPHISYLKLTFSRSGRIWSYLEASVAIWRHLELSEAIWSYLKLSGTIWSYLKLSGAIWSSLELSGTSGAICSFLELSGAVCSYLLLSGAI